MIFMVSLWDIFFKVITLTLKKPLKLILMLPHFSLLFTFLFFFLLSFPVLTSLIKTKTKHRNGPLRGGWTRLKIETSRKSSSTNFSTKTSTCRDSQTGSWKPTRSTTKLKKTLRSHQSTSKAFISITLAQVQVYFFFLKSLSLPRIWALFSLHEEQKN